jgi:hypothetical protein
MEKKVNTNELKDIPKSFNHFTRFTSGGDNIIIKMDDLT